MVICNREIYVDSLIWWRHHPTIDLYAKQILLPTWHIIIHIGTFCATFNFVLKLNSPMSRPTRAPVCVGVWLHAGWHKHMGMLLACVRIKKYFFFVSGRVPRQINYPACLALHFRSGRFTFKQVCRLGEHLLVEPTSTADMFLLKPLHGALWWKDHQLLQPFVPFVSDFIPNKVAIPYHLYK